MSDDPSSRFISQSVLDAQHAAKEEQWKAAYERIGIEPPKELQQKDEVYDGRSLAEKLAANKAAKQEAYEQAHKLSNQFRALDPDEIGFLDEIAVKRYEDEKKVKAADDEGLKEWRAAVQARDTAGPPPIASTSTKPPSPSVPKSTSQNTLNKPAPAKKAAKLGLKGVVMAKKRSRAETKTEEPKGTTTVPSETSSNRDGGKEGNSVKETVTSEPKLKGKALVGLGGSDEDESEDGGGDKKRRKVE